MFFAFAKSFAAKAFVEVWLAPSNLKYLNTLDFKVSNFENIEGA